MKSPSGFVVSIVMLGTLIAAVRSANADLIKQYAPVGGLGQSNEAPGEEVLTPAGGPWNNIQFSWFDSNGQTPPTYSTYTEGDLFILTQAYTGLPSGLSAATPGFVAESLTGARGEGTLYQFAPSITLTGNTEYFFYTDVHFSSPLATATGAAANNLVRYLAVSSTDSFHSAGNDSAWLFQLDGTTPEPSRVVGVLGLAFMGFIGLVWRRRRAAT